MRVAPRVRRPELPALVAAGVLVTAGVAVALVVAIWATWGAIPALAVALLGAVAATAWARRYDDHLQEQARYAAGPRPVGPARFRDPEDEDQGDVDGVAG